MGGGDRDTGFGPGVDAPVDELHVAGAVPTEGYVGDVTRLCGGHGAGDSVDGGPFGPAAVHVELAGVEVADVGQPQAVAHLPAGDLPAAAHHGLLSRGRAVAVRLEGDVVSGDVKRFGQGVCARPEQDDGTVAGLADGGHDPGERGERLSLGARPGVVAVG
jgi:hypothetical protein